MLRYILLALGTAYTLFGATMGDQGFEAAYYRDLVAALTLAVFISPWLVEHIEN